MMRILLVDDEPAITESLAYAFERTGIETITAGTLKAADSALDTHHIDLIVLDIVLPDGNGLDWLRDLRARQNTPVIILSSHDEIVDQVVGLELGADDYVGKPFSPRAIIARVRAILRRSHPENSPTKSGIKLDIQKRQAWANGTSLALSRTEFDLLSLFASQPGRVYERDLILTRVWGPEVAVTERTVDVHVKTLRKKLVSAGVSPETIETVRGVGYRLAED